MIKDKVIDFGYADIVGAVCLNKLIFHDMIIPRRCGMHIDGYYNPRWFKGEEVVFEPSFTDILVLLNKINAVLAKKIKWFCFHGYFFSFKEYNEEGIIALYELIRLLNYSIPQSVVC